MRLQILHLPGPEDEHPFALIIDNAGEDQDYLAPVEGFGQRIGARAVAIFSGEVEIG